MTPPRFAGGLMLLGMPLAVHASGNLQIAYYGIGALSVQLALLPLFWRGSDVLSLKWAFTFLYIACIVAMWVVVLQLPANRSPEFFAVLLALAPAGVSALVLRLVRSKRP